VVIGAGAKILGPVTVADDARISYNSVILEDIQKNTPEWAYDI
jgi:serine O-acetyltransferase